MTLDVLLADIAGFLLEHVELREFVFHGLAVFEVVMRARVQTRLENGHVVEGRDLAGGLAGVDG